MTTKKQEARDIRPRQVIELPKEGTFSYPPKRTIRTVYINCSVPGPGSWVIFDGGWKRVTHIQGTHWILT